MARRKKGNPVHGWVVLDKPQGMTSTQAVGAVRHLFVAQKAGHAGTLDPLATGVLPIALGEATKTVPFAVDGRKVYRFSVRWGVETNTDDAEGTAVATDAMRPSRSQIEALLPQFIGEIMQTPPAFSAIKVDGERAYDLARSGAAVELEARPVAIERLELVTEELLDAGDRVVLTISLRGRGRSSGAEISRRDFVSGLTRQGSLRPLEARWEAAAIRRNQRRGAVPRSAARGRRI